MKKLFDLLHLLSGIAFFTLLYGCSNSTIEEKVEPSMLKGKESVISNDSAMKRMSLEFSYDEDKNFVESLGYDVSTFEDFGDFYIVGDDYFVEKETLLKIRQDSSYCVSTNAMSYDPNMGYEIRLDPIYEKLHFTYNTYNTLDNYAFFEQAVNAWNDIPNCNLDFRLGADPGNRFSVSILEEGVGTGTIIRDAIGPIPNGPKSLIIDVLHPIWEAIDGEQKKYLLMHLIGHVIRLSDLTDYQLSFNPNSIMRPHSELSTTNKSIWSGLSDEDKNSLAATYPIPEEPTLNYYLNTTPIDVDEKMHIKAGGNNTLEIEYTNYYYQNNNGLRFEYKILHEEELYSMGGITNNRLNLKVEDPNAYIFVLSVYDHTDSLLETYETELYVYEEDKPSIINLKDRYEEGVHVLRFEEVVDPYGSGHMELRYTSSNENDVVEKKSDSLIEVAFNSVGVRTLTLDVSIDGFLLFSYLYEFDVEKYVPNLTYSWTPTPQNTKNKLLKEEIYELNIKNISSKYIVDLQVNPRVANHEYTIEPIDSRNFKLSFTDTGIYDVIINVYEKNNECLTSKTIEVTAIDAPSLNPAWSSPTEIGEYFSLNTNYTLNLNYVNEYYNNSNGFTYDYMVKYKRIDDNVLVDRTSTVLISKTGQQALFNFNLPGEYLITASIKYGSALVDTYETTCRVVGGRIVMNNGDDEAILNIPYSFIYYYWHPEHQNVTYEFKLSEELFDMGSANNIIYDQDRENSFMVSFRDYGCYYIEAIVKDGYTVCDRKIVNFTKLYRLDPCVFELYEIKANPNTGQEVSTLFKYKLHLGTESNITERFYGEAQRVKEVRRAFYIGKERRVEREFTHYIHPILLPKESQTTLELSDGGFGRTITPFDSYEVYYTYNGYIYYPEDRVGLANSTNPEDLPREGVKYEVINTSGVMGIDL